MLHSGNTYATSGWIIPEASEFEYHRDGNVWLAVASKLHAYVELNCTDSHKYTNCLSIERQKCHTIRTFYLNLVFIKDYLFFSFVLGFVLFGCILF